LIFFFTAFFFAARGCKKSGRIFFCFAQRAGEKKRRPKILNGGKSIFKKEISPFLKNKVRKI
jgi:hypothetical protein